MSQHAQAAHDIDGDFLEEDAQQPASSNERARPIPRISIQAFCDDVRMADVLQYAADDRRLSKTHVSVHMGGIAAAVAHYVDSPTPNLIIVDSALNGGQLIAELDRLAESCDPGTKVIVIGRHNDVLLYRELLKRGVGEYLVAPIEPMGLMESISNLYNNPDTDPVGHVFAFIGAKGGVGSSTICHNVGWTMSEILKTNVTIADLDLAFGTTGLDFNQDPVQGIAEALAAPERLDDQLLDRLLTKCSEHLSIFAAPVVIERDYDISPEACEMVIDVVRQNVPFVAIDLPHGWSAWSKRVLLQADEVVITAAPDLANLRNAKNIVDLLKTSRKNDNKPHLILNMANLPKRQEITVKEFEQALDAKVMAVIDYDSETFSQASNNGQMIEELSAKAKAVEKFHDIALKITRRKDVKAEKSKFAVRRHRADPREAEAQALRTSPCSAGVRMIPCPRNGPSRSRLRLRLPSSPWSEGAGAAAPERTRALPPPRPEPVAEVQRKHSEEYYDVKTTVFNALIDTIRSDAARQARHHRCARRNSRHRQRDHSDQKRRDVDFRAGRAARRYLQRRSWLWTARAAVGAR